MLGVALQLIAFSSVTFSFTKAHEVFDEELIEFAQVSSVQSEVATVQAVREEVRHRHKLGLVFVTQPWCGACDRLKRSMNGDDSPLHALMKEFVIFNHEGDNVKQWQAPPLHDPRKNDTYVPRVYFLGLDGEFLPQRGPSGRHPYFYKDAMALLKSVVAVLEDKKTELGMLQVDANAIIAEQDILDGAVVADTQDKDVAKVEVTVSTDALRAAPGPGVQASFGIMTVGALVFVVLLVLIGGVQSLRENPKLRAKIPKPMHAC